MQRLALSAALALSLAPLARASADEPAAHQHGGADASDKDSAVPSHQKHPLDKNAPKPTGEMVELKAGDSTSQAYVARPKGKVKGAVLVMHEWWGLNDWVKTQADELAKHGYLALAVDLYKGKVATTPEEAGKMMAALDEKNGDLVEEAGREWLKKEDKGLAVATLGWCMGGGQSLRASLHDTGDVVATVMYYGMPVDDVAKLKTLRGPVLGIWADKDGWITKDKVAAFDKALKAAGVKHEFHHYDADHAFANPSGGKYNGKDAKDAWKKTLAFLDKNLAGKRVKGSGDESKATSEAGSDADAKPAAAAGSTGSGATGSTGTSSGAEGSTGSVGTTGTQGATGK